jgi:hypothetical protein
MMEVRLHRDAEDLVLELDLTNLLFPGVVNGHFRHDLPLSPPSLHSRRIMTAGMPL